MAFSFVGSATIPEEKLALQELQQNIPNFRPVDGLQGVYRSTHLDALSFEDKKRLQEEFGVRTVIDLRSKKEANIPSAGHITHAPDVELKQIPITNSIGFPLFRSVPFRKKLIFILKFLFGDKLQAKTYLLENSILGREGLLGLNKLFLDHGGTHIKEVMKVFAQKEDSSAVLIHCISGKDRTGLACALLQSLSGLESAAIAHDYQITESRLGELHLQQLAKENTAKGLPPGFENSPAEVMTNTLAYIDSRYGSVENYLLWIGISQPELDVIKANLVAVDQIKMSPTARCVKITSLIEGPYALAYTRQGSIPHIAQPSTLTPSIQKGALLLPLEHFIDLIAPSGAPSSTRSTRSNDWEKNIHEYCSLDEEAFVVAATHEPTRVIKKLEWFNGGSKALGFVASSTNRILVDQKMLKTAARLVSPNALLMADPSVRLYNGIGTHELIVPGPQSSASQERKAHNRWVSYLESVMQEEEDAVSKKMQVWVCVGGSKPEGIKHSTLHIKESIGSKVTCFGICLPTLSHRNSVDEMDREYLEKTWNENADTFLLYAPPETPRFVLGIANFKDIVKAISKGYDIIDDSWIEKESVAGQALFVDFNGSLADEPENARISSQLPQSIYTFDLTPNGKRETKKYGSKGPTEGSASVTVTPADEWKLDTRPLSSTCQCWTCTRPHSRAYIHHLLCVNDMLAYVMLQHHNLHQMHQFVSQIKASIKDGSFVAKAERFMK